MMDVVESPDMVREVGEHTLSNASAPNVVAEGSVIDDLGESAD